MIYVLKTFHAVLNFNLDPFMLSLKVSLLSVSLHRGFLNLLPEVFNNFLSEVLAS